MRDTALRYLACKCWVCKYISPPDGLDGFGLGVKEHAVFQVIKAADSDFLPISMFCDKHSKSEADKHLVLAFFSRATFSYF